MASQYENYGANNSQAQTKQQQQKPFIDFYRQQAQMQYIQQTLFSRGSNQTNQPSYQSMQQQQQMSQQQQITLSQHQLQQQQYSGNQGSSQGMSMGLNFGSHQSSQNQFTLSNMNSGGINVYQTQPRDRQSYEGSGGMGGRPGTGMLITSNDMIDYQNQQLMMDPSPINAGGIGQRYLSPTNPHLGGNIGFLQGGSQSDNFIDSNFNTIDTKKDLKQIQIDTSKSNAASTTNKRRSIENTNKDTLMGTKQQKDLYGSLNNDPSNSQVNQNRQLINGAKSALSNYGTQGFSNSGTATYPGNQAIKQINKNAKVERDPVMDQQSSYQNKRSLAKSQSQNRLVLLSQEALNKNNPYHQGDDKDNQTQDKNSFFKDQLMRGGQNEPQDLLYKQHMQYSGAHNQKAGWLLKASSSNLILSRMTTKSECTFCNKTSAGGMISQSCIPHHCSSIYCSKDQQGMMIQNNLSKKYSTNRDYYNLKIVNDLIYNENTHIVSIFKDYLILDDINEFLKRSYTQQETKVRLPKLCSFYEKYSQVFPNYVVLPESKYMFKNIQRKQKLIDEQYQLQEEIAKKQHQTLLDEDKLFNTKFYNSYYSNMGGPSDLNMSRKQYEDQAKAIAEQVGKKLPVKRIDQMKIDELVDRFLMKDSESNIQLFTSVALDFSEFQNSFINHTQHSQSKISEIQRTSTKNQQQQQQQNKVQLQTQQQPLNKVQVLSQQTTPNQQQQTNLQQQQQQKSQKLSQPKTLQQNNLTPQITVSQGKRSLDAQTKRIPQNTLQVQQNSTTQGGIGGGVKKQQQQKNSFNNQQQKGSTGNLQQLQVTNKQEINKLGSQDSHKNTPRLQKGQAHTINLIDQQQKPIIQTSPATKEAISNYLQDCNIESEEINLKQNQKIIDQHFQTQKMGMGSLLSPTSTHLGSNLLESPQMKSPNFLGPKNNLQNAGSQSSLLSSQQQFQNSLNQQNRQNMKSQLVMPTVQQITSMKKSTRLSNGGQGLQKTNQINQRKNISPIPTQQQVSQQNQNQCVIQPSSSRNQLINNNTQKSVKSTATTIHNNNANNKYLSGGNEQYQKLLQGNNNNNNYMLQQQQQQQNSYATQQHYDTINSNIINSSTKKTAQIQSQRSKTDLHNNNDVNTLSNTKQQLQMQLIKPPEICDNVDNEAITNEDCDDFGIADERFASPDANKLIFQTLDDNIQGLLSQGRQSLDGTNTMGSNNYNPQQMLLLTSTEDRLLANTNNYDQIKKHLEQFISVNNANGQNTQNLMASLPSQHTFDMNTIQSNSKRYNIHVKSSDKYSNIEEVKQSISSFQPQTSVTNGGGYNRENNNNANSTYSQQDQINNSRNGTNKKQFESMKQKIRGQYGVDGNQQQQQTVEGTQQTINSANKTPNKSSTHSKKSTHAMGSTQQMMLQQNRMSLDANQVMMMMPTSNTNQGGVPMSSTSAGGRQLSFSQTSFAQNSQNYRSITNLQQRKGSNNHYTNTKELSIESKRLSGQNRQSFKDGNSQQQQHVQTSLNNESNKMIKRSATGKMLHLQDANSQSQNYGQMQNTILQSIGSTSTFQNPNFMSNSHVIGNNKLYSTATGNQHISQTQQIQNMHHQQQLQQQAAGQVRVMTPSYSLASLSKIISPTTTTSPITNTNTTGSHNNISHSQTLAARKQQANQKSIGKSSALGIHSATSHLQNAQGQNSALSNSHSQNFLMADKNTKLVTSSLHQNAQKTIVSSKAGMKNTNSLGTRQNNTIQAQSHPIQVSTTINQKIGRQIPSNHHQIHQNHTLNSQQQINSNTFQATPRGGVSSQLGNQDSNSLQNIQINPNQIQVQARRIQQNANIQYGGDNSQQNLSIENNSNVVKSIEQNKHPKFMKTIEEYSNHGSATQQQQQHSSGYNTMLSSTIGHNNKGGQTLTNSLSQAQLEVRNQKNKIQTVVNSNQASIKRQTLGTGPSALSQSGSVSHFKSPSQQINTKKQLSGRYLNM